MRWIAMVALVVLSVASAQVRAFQHGQQFQGLCDIMTCAEYYSVARASSATYNGPLFQLFNGTTTLDIGQTPGHYADMTTWSAFCSGVASNCKYSKIYAQVHTGGANDLIPSVFSAPSGPNCSGGPATKCAAPFAIEAATGLPVFISGASQEYALVSDQNATGVNGPASSSTIFYNGQNILLAGGMCCGPFGMGHAYNATPTIGTDFFISISYGQFANPQGNQCQTAATFCIGADEESVGDWADYNTLVAGTNVIVSITYDQPSNKVTANLNLAQYVNKTPVATFSNTGSTIHLGGGGDLSQPAPAYMREIAVGNSAISLATHQSLANNVKSFFPGLRFGPP